MNSVQNPYDIMDLEDVTSESLTEVLMLEAADLIRYYALGLVITLQDSKENISRQPVKPKYTKIQKSVGKGCIQETFTNTVQAFLELIVFPNVFIYSGRVF